VAAVEAGFPYARYRALQRELGLPAVRVERALALSARTVGRRRRQGRFTPQESDRICRLERAWRAALARFGEVGAARGWLATPNERLGGRDPLELLATEAGGGAVASLLATVGVSGDP
jgi:putative toxin-antitoxin system antitoxin component (TIGR02293 family)